MKPAGALARGNRHNKLQKQVVGALAIAPKSLEW
jgi:hypothetical protein